MNITKTEIYNIRKCEAFLENKFFENMNKLSIKYQNDFNDKPGKNKI